MICLDTHVVFWLHANEATKLIGALPHLAGRKIVVSPIVLLELQFLYEIGRLTVSPSILVRDLGAQFGLAVSDHPFADVVAHAAGVSWTRDPFDRLIVAQALALKLPLCTADKKIRAHFAGAVWGKRVGRSGPMWSK